MNKVLIVIHQLNIGGVQKSLITFLNAIDYRKNDVTLYIRKERLDLLKEVPKDVRVVVNRYNLHHMSSVKQIIFALIDKATGLLGLRTVHRNVEKRYANYLSEQQLLYEIRNYPELSNDYNVVISYIQGFTAEFVANNIKAKKKYVFWHGSTDENHELHQSIFQYFDAVIGVSLDIRLVLQRLYSKFENKMRYITNYVDPKLICSLKDEYTVSKCTKGLTLCSCGRFTMVKGFDIALKAADQLRKNGVRFLWYFVGDGPERENLERNIIEYNLQDQIVITGLQKNPYPYMDACDIYVQPSREEAWPLTIQEAKILCKPVVTTATVGGKSHIEDGVSGFISDFSGVNISDKIIILFKNDDVRKKIKCNLKRLDYEKGRQNYIKSINLLLEG